MFNEVIRVATDNSLGQMQQLDNVTENMANVNTYGYKGKRFESYLTEWGTVAGTTRTDQSQGAMQLTKRPLDMAIQGPGYFVLTQPDGKTAYTRDGRFTVNQDGYLVSLHGDLVGDGFQIPPDYEKFLVQPDGTVQLQKKGDSMPTAIGKLTLAGFRNPEGLKDIGGDKLIPTETSGVPYKVEGSTEVKQGTLERTNVDLFSQVDLVMRTNASVISGFRLIKFVDTLYQEALNLRQ